MKDRGKPELRCRREAYYRRIPNSRLWFLCQTSEQQETTAGTGKVDDTGYPVTCGGFCRRRITP